MHEGWTDGPHDAGQGPLLPVTPLCGVLHPLQSLVGCGDSELVQLLCPPPKEGLRVVVVVNVLVKVAGVGKSLGTGRSAS